jgi:hypothetical protein
MTVYRVQVRRDGEVRAEVADSNEAFYFLLDAQPFSTSHAVAWEGWTVTDPNGRSLPEWEPALMKEMLL